MSNGSIQQATTRNLAHLRTQSYLLFRVRGIREYAMKRTAIAAGFWDEDSYPALKAKRLDNPRLFANREELVSSMCPAKGGVIAEVGVAHGVFAEYLLNELRPRKFVASSSRCTNGINTGMSLRRYFSTI